MYFRDIHMKKWDVRWVKIAKQFASFSEDESTKHGAVIIGKNNTLLSQGWNGLPRGVKSVAAREERPEKYEWYEHAERNAIYNAAYNGIKLKGSEMVVTGSPCTKCARAIIQSGITAVFIFPADMNYELRYTNNIGKALGMFYEGNVSVYYFEKTVEEVTTAYENPTKPKEIG